MYTYTVLKLRVKQVTYESKIASGNTKRQALQTRLPECLGSRKECCWGYVSIYENTPKKLLQLYLVVQGRVQFEHSSHIVKVSVEATC